MGLNAKETKCDKTKIKDHAEKKWHNIITLQITTVKLEYIKIWMKNQGQWHKIERVDCYEMNYTFQNIL